VTLETISFDNQSKARGFFKEMLNRYVPGETVSLEDSIHLAALFKRHPSYQSKVGPGVDFFEVMPEIRFSVLLRGSQGRGKRGILLYEMHDAKRRLSR